MKTRYGIIGMGRWATQTHIPVLNQIDEAEMAALSSRNPKNLQKGMDISKGSPRAFRDYSDLLALEDVDAVIITTPNHTHAEMARDALEHGKHVFCEKPLATTVEDCDMLIKLAKKQGKVLQVGLELRYAPMFLEVKEKISQGKIGKPCLAFCNLSRGWLRPGWREDPQLTGGMFVELVCHYLDLFNYLLDSQPVKVAALGGKTDGHTDIDHGYAIIDYDKGTKATIQLNLLSPYDRAITMTAIGTSGKLEADLQDRELTLWQNGASMYRYSFSDGNGNNGYSGIREQHIDFLNCIQNGKTPRASAQAGRDVVALAIAVQEAMEKGTIVRLGKG